MSAQPAEGARRDAGPHGVLVVDKPAGPTSHDVVDRVRRALDIRRVGHTGTLDPFATGVLAVCVGRATRLARFLAEGEKAYLAGVRLGFATTTDDATGQALGPQVAADVDRAALERACARLRGALLQVPPAFSAKRFEGRKLYELARRGAAPELDPVPVQVHALELLSFEGDTVELAVRCSPGTYVRALARDLGALLGVGAHLAALRRTRSGSFGLGEAVTWEQIPSLARERIQPLAALLPQLPALILDVDGAAGVRHGRDLTRAHVVGEFPEPPPAPRVRLLDAQGALLGLAVPRGFGRESGPLPIEPAFHPDIVLVD